MIGDLHCHSHFSDGSLSIDELVLYAKRAGLDFVAVTDHDTMAGVNRAEQLGKRYGISVIGGVEFSAFDMKRNRKAHLLCYLPKRPDRLEGTFKRTLESRGKAVHESMTKIMRCFPVTEEHIMKYAKCSASVYNVHIMQALVDLGYDDKPYGKLYEQLFGVNGSCVSKHEYPDVWEVARLIKSAGGICVLAHPTIYDSFELMSEMAEKDEIDGIERFYPRVQESDISEIDRVIAEFNLIPTGGTDFHGGYSSHPNPIGTCMTMKKSLDRIFALSKVRSVR